MEENKQLICTRLLDALVLTREGSDLLSIEYYQADGVVRITFKDGRRCFINMSYESGYLMIMDIIMRITNVMGG